MSKSFYVTTPIYYVNDAPHIGHAYTSTLADVLTRYHRMIGIQSFFLTGTDEHGQKVQQAAAKRGVDPQEHVDQFNLRFQEMWKRMDIQYDHFIRTTDPDHKAYVQECLQKLWDQGEIYAKEYEGWYSVGEERFFSEDELVDGKDPISHRPVEWIQEKNYFFKMGQYQKRLIQHIEENPEWILPDFRRNEVLGFLRQPLNDLCISRPQTRLSWGIPLPFDQEFVTYVWFDALLNYVSAVRKRTHADGSPIWPATMHLIGKDILTTHCVYWPTMMMALNIELPRHILAHGWWLNGGAKMSKSSGNVVNPNPYIDQFGADAFRYFLIRDMVVGQDSTFSDEAFIRRLNSDLANDLGNGLNRIHRLSLVNFEGQLPSCQTWGDEEQALKDLCLQTIEEVKTLIPSARLSQMVERIMSLPRAVNRYLEIKAPWKLAKIPESRGELATVMWVGAETLRITLQLLSPIMPSKCQTGLQMLGVDLSTENPLRWGVLQGEEALGEGQALFPRIQQENTDKKTQQAQSTQAKAPESTIARIDLRVARIIQVENHPEADALYKLTVDAGEEQPRTVCAGLRSSYKADQLQNRLVVLFANLKPAKLRGIPSAGMLLAADGPSEQAILLTPPESSKPGTPVRFVGTPEVAADYVAKIKDFEKVHFVCSNQKILWDGKILQADGQDIDCAAPDNAEVH